jgi:enoyl-CoA hydratase
VLLATKRTLRHTASLTEHSDAVDAEIEPQLASLTAPAFAERLARLRAKIGGQ